MMLQPDNNIMGVGIRIISTPYLKLMRASVSILVSSCLRLSMAKQHNCSGDLSNDISSVVAARDVVLSYTPHILKQNRTY
jgi:hypothetical protein